MPAKPTTAAKPASSVTATKPTTSKPPASKPTAAKPDATWTVAALRAAARTAGVTGYSRMTNATLLEHLTS